MNLDNVVYIGSNFKGMSYTEHCILHLLISVVRTLFQNIGLKPDGSQILVSHNLLVSL